MISQSELKNRFEYRSDGTFVRRYSTSGRNNSKGALVGYYPSKDKGRSHRYAEAKIDGKTYKIHRLVYLYHHGFVPDQLDHVNGDLLDNRIENLRPCNASQNACNRVKFSSNASGYKGVSWHQGSKRWFAYVDVNKKRKNIGYFNSLEEAALAVATARSSLHGEFAKHE